MKKTKTIAGVAVLLQDDYARGVRCPSYHGGNRGLVWLRGEWWQCQGCGSHYGHRTVAQWQRDAAQYDGAWKLSEREVRS